MDKLLEMLKWKRPGGKDVATKFFADTHLLPVFGEPDIFGNYILIIHNKDGSHPNLCFTAHYDTVHSVGGFQEIDIKDGIVTAVASDCLGADCTTGIWLCLEMIQQDIPAVYVIHADEESGCKGSSALVASKPSWVTEVGAVISFDRFGTKSIITHQCGLRTASEAFAISFADALGMPSLTADDTGIYTDSNEYASVVSECTNISVGYYNQHTSVESQDLVYLETLRDALVSADWSLIEIERDPKIVDLDSYGGYGKSYYNEWEGGDIRSTWEKDDILELLLSYPEDITECLHRLGITAEELAESAGINTPSYVSKYLEREVG